MASRLDPLLDRAPAWLRDLAVTIGSARLQRLRRSGAYRTFYERYRLWRHLDRDKLLAIQQSRLVELIRWARRESPYYQRKYAGLPDTLAVLPVLEKHELQEHIGEIVTASPRWLQASFTGGTTGRAITVYNGRRSLQERFAILDAWYNEHGFYPGRDRVAWFSGRRLLWRNDEARRRFWRTNWLDRIRYYSTFHMSPANLGAYVEDLRRFRPQFLAGFPSAISEVARFMEAHGLAAGFRPAVAFVTSETLLPAQREQIERVFGCKVRNQYSASEGAPFIVECRQGNLHYDIATGVIEVVDGEMLVTCFFTHETPIIRYRIGDAVTVSARGRCPCGWDTPLMEAIHGRTMDYIEVPGRGRIFNSQIGDCVKDVPSVLKFQVAMHSGRLQVDLVADRERFEAHDRAVFLAKLAERVGDVPVDIRYVDDIPRAPSGKHSLIRTAG